MGILEGRGGTAVGQMSGRLGTKTKMRVEKFVWLPLSFPSSLFERIPRSIGVVFLTSDDMHLRAKINYMA